VSERRADLALQPCTKLSFSFLVHLLVERNVTQSTASEREREKATERQIGS